MKKFAMRTLVLAMFAALLLCFGLAPTRANAAETVASGTCGENLSWKLVDGVLTISGEGAMETYDNEFSIAPWRDNAKDILSVVIEDGVTTVGGHAFSYCSNLTGVTIPDSVVSIGNSAFYACSSLKNITIPGSVTVIGDWAFWGCASLASATIQSGITSIGFSAFRNCTSLDSVTIPGSVTNVGNYAFSGCTSLASATIQSGATAIGHYAFSRCTSLVSVTISDGVTGIGNYAFEYCAALISVTIPGSVTSIGDSAFLQCTSLASATIQNGVVSIGGSAFEYCTSLNSVTIPDSVTYIGEQAFSCCTSLASVTIPDSVTDIGNNAFSGCRALASVTIPDSVTGIGFSAFRNCTSLTAVTIPNSVTGIEDYVFYQCSNLSTVTIPGSVTAICSYAFSGCDSLDTVHYGGTRSQREAISIAEGNASLIDATWHYAKQEVQIVTQPVSVAVAEGEMAIVTVGATGDDLTYRWYYKNAGESSYTYTSSFKGNTYKVEMNEARNGRKVLCRVYDKYGNVVQSNTVKLSKAIKLQLVKPLADAYTQLGKKINLSVEAQGEGLTYAWYVKNANDQEFVLSSITASTYSPNMTKDKVGRYVYCVITDQYGNSVTTNIVRLWLIATITKQPSSVIVAEGELAVVTVGAAGDGLTYRWYYKDVGASTYTYTSDFKGNTYTVEMNEACNGRKVLCRVYDQYGNVVQSNTVKLTKANKLQQVKPLADAYTQLGKKINLSVEAQGEGLTYAWYVKDANDQEFVLSSITASTYSPNMTKDKVGRYVYCVITDQYGNSVTTNTVRLWLIATITKQPSSVIVAEGEMAVVTVGAAGDGLTYRWYYKDVGASTYTYTSDFKGNTYTAEMNEACNGRKVLCRVYDQYGNVVQSNTVKLTKANKLQQVKPLADAYTQLGKKINLSVEAEGNSLTYAWYVKDANDQEFVLSSITASTYSPNMTKDKVGRYVYCVITDQYGNSVTTNTVRLWLIATITKQPSSVIVAEGEMAVVTVGAAGDGLTYRWYYKDVGASTYTYTSNFKGNTYEVAMNAVCDGRQILCRVYDQYGNVVQTKTVVIKMK